MEKKIIENHQINIEERMRVREGHVFKEQKVTNLIEGQCFDGNSFRNVESTQTTETSGNQRCLKSAYHPFREIFHVDWK
jgi:hypothetical protein